VIVADASALIALARIGHLGLLRELFGSVAIPIAVEEEIMRHPRRLEGAGPEWSVSHTASDQAAVASLRRELDRGEAEALVLAAQLGVPVLIDEQPGRQAARSRGLAVTGTLGVLLAAKQAGLIERLDVALRKLQAEGFHMSADLMADLLRAADEE
jgi:predicted nucleic acid-binding protein